MEGEFIIDEANLVQSADRQQIKQISAALLRERGNPIIVVTIPSLAKYGWFEHEDGLC
ncbi:MAG: TPM domain-containing protein [Terriglobales bacterium]